MVFCYELMSNRCIAKAEHYEREGGCLIRLKRNRFFALQISLSLVISKKTTLVDFTIFGCFWLCMHEDFS